MIVQGIYAMLAAAGLWAFTATPSAAVTSLTQRDLDYFTEESYACRSDRDPDVDWEYHLCRAIVDGKSVNGAVTSFATKIGHSERNALAIAAAIIEVTRFDSECDGSANESSYDCRFEPGAPAYDRFVEANRLDASGELAFVIGKNVGSKYAPMEQRRRFLELIIQHPGRLLTFRRMLAYTRDDIWIFAIAAAGEVDVETAKLIFLRHYYNSMYESSNWDGASITLLELLLAKNPDDEIRRLLSYERQAIVVSPKSPGAETDLLDLFSAARPPAISDGAVFLVAEPDLFSGVWTPFRLFVFSSEEVDRINAQGAPFYPARVRAIFSRLDDSEHYVIWSAGWAGGEFIVRCKADQCETEVTSEWIT